MVTKKQESNYKYTLCLKKRANFETVYLEVIRIDFDDIWQKYSKKL